MININHTLFIQMLDFLFLLFVLNIILYKPLLSKIRERYTRIEDLKNKATALKGEAQKNEEEYTRRIKEAEEKAKEDYVNLISKTLKEKDERISQKQREALEEIRKYEEEINKQIELELSSSQDYSIEIANKIYRQIIE